MLAGSNSETLSMDRASLHSTLENSRISRALNAWIALLAERAVREHLTQNPVSNQSVNRNRPNRVRLQTRKKDA